MTTSSERMAVSSKKTGENAMFRRIVICLLLTAFLLTVSLADAQQPKKNPRVGYISVSGSTNNPGRLVEAFRKGLRDLGYIEGKNIVIELRYAAEEPGRDFVAELVKTNVDVLVSSSTATIRAAMRATKTIPIVMIAPFDPVDEVIGST
jgi:putative ABC transport system substrate-binding protein